MFFFVTADYLSSADVVSKLEVSIKRVCVANLVTKLIISISSDSVLTTDVCQTANVV